MSTHRKIGALAVVAAIGLVAACTPLPMPNDLVRVERPPLRKHVNTADGVPFSFRASAHGWERFGDISLNKSERGPQGAEAMIYWSSFPDGDYADYYGHEAHPCTRLLSPPVGPSATNSRSRDLEGTRHRTRQGSLRRRRWRVPRETPRAQGS